MDSLLEGRCAVVTGAASGIGRQIARTFADSGASVVVSDLRKDPREGGRPTHELIAEETDADVTFVEGDVTDLADLRTTIDAAEEFGGVDVLVNNAGLLVRDPFLEFDEADYDRIMAVNVKAPFFASQLAAGRMLEGDGGTIINLSSVSGLRGAAETVAYCASKGAIRLMTYALAAELGPRGIRVNAIHPGAIETMQAIRDSRVISEGGDDFLQHIPLGRFGQPADVADAALYLASDLAEYVNGASLVVDGGRYNAR